MRRKLHRARKTASFALTVGIVVCAWQSAFAGLISAEAFLELKPKWERLVGSKFQIEGRVSTAGGNTLLMRKLQALNFVSAEEVPKLTGADTVEIHGMLARNDDDQLIFRVTSVKKLISDVDRLNRLRLDLRADKPDKWYELGDWAIARGVFYSDDKLISEGRVLHRSGLSREHTRLPVKDYQSLRAMAIKAEDLNLGETLKIEYLYEGNYHGWLNERREATSLQLAGIAVRVVRDLPGAGTPLPNLPEAFRKAWQGAPLTGYRTTTSLSARNQHHRLLYQAIMLESIQIDAHPDGKNGKEIASRLRREVPEFGALADQYITDELNWRLKNVTTLSRFDMLALQRELRERNEPDKAQQAIDEWFRNREAELLKQGVDGLIDLASEYEELMDDEGEAIRLLLMADRKKPGIGIVGERLERHGYEYIDDEWRDPEAVRERRNTAINVAMREGRVTKGMTAKQVEKTLGRPTAKTRILTGRNVIEYWMFGTSGTRLSVRLQRLANRREPIVDAISQLGR